MGPWHYTNESLEAITQALDVQPDDRILSVCSIGAQPLALLENLNGTGSLLAIDINPEQIELAKSVITNIIQENQEQAQISAPKSPNYFTPERLARIRGNLQKLNFLNIDAKKLHEQFQEPTFTKGYFSNVMVSLYELARIFKPGALIYIAYKPFKISINSPEDIKRVFRYYYEYDLEELAIADFYAIDTKRTLKANQLETLAHQKFPIHLSHNDFSQWRPIIYRRI